MGSLLLQLTIASNAIRTFVVAVSYNYRFMRKIEYSLSISFSLWHLLYYPLLQLCLCNVLKCPFQFRVSIQFFLYTLETRSILCFITSVILFPGTQGIFTSYLPYLVLTAFSLNSPSIFDKSSSSLSSTPRISRL